MALSLPLLFGIVSIAVAIPDAPEAELRVVQSCRKALGDDACVPSGSGGGESEYYARVTLVGDELRVALTVSGGRELLRELSFSAEDRPEQRWIAAGLLVAAMIAAVPPRPGAEGRLAGVEETEGHRAPSSRADVVARSVSPRAASTTFHSAARPGGASAEPPLTLRQPPFAVDIGLLVGSGELGEAWELGGEARGTSYIEEWFGLALALGATHGLDGDPSRSALRLEAGPDIRLLSHDSGAAIGLGVAGVGEVLRVAPDAGVEPRARSTVRWGGKTDLRLVMGTGPIVPWLGVAATLLTPEAVVRMDGREIWATRPWSVLFGVGARFQFGTAGSGD